MIFDWLKEILNPPEKVEVQHPYFGKLTYVSFKNVRGEKCERWEGELLTPLENHPLLIIIEADIHGPNDEHLTKLEKLIHQFPKLQPKIFSVLFEQWKEVLAECRDNEWSGSRARNFDTLEEMAELYELGSVELQFSYRDDIGEYDTTAWFIAIDRDWNVSFSGGAD
jgi:hypothetical protein